MRLAAVADIHLYAENHERDVRQFSPVNDLADVLVIAGDFTNHGMPEEMRAVLGRARTHSHSRHRGARQSRP